MTPDTLTRSDLDRELEQLRADLTREHSAELARALEQQRGGTARLGSQWRSAGEFLKALARGDDDALEFHRAFTGGTTADTAQPATWIDDKIKFVEERRREINSFTRETLPPEGMTLEYLRLKSNSITVGKQINQGESAGLGFGKVELDSATAAIETAGGWTTFSRQAIERASATYLNTGLKALDLAYARYTEATFKAVLAAAVTAQVTANNDLELVATPDVYDWRDLIIDAAERFEENGFVLAGLKVSSDVFKRMQRIELPSGDPAFTVSGERVNREGELNLPGIEGEFARVKVEVVRGAAANFATFWDPVAVTFWESAGAPLMLQDESIINLSKDFSEYGYIAAASQFPTALVPLTFAA